jgi:hypothetical protein
MVPRAPPGFELGVCGVLGPDAPGGPRQVLGRGHWQICVVALRAFLRREVLGGVRAIHLLGLLRWHGMYVCVCAYTSINQFWVLFSFFRLNT